MNRRGFLASATNDARMRNAERRSRRRRRAVLLDCIQVFELSNRGPLRPSLIYLDGNWHSQFFNASSPHTSDGSTCGYSVKGSSPSSLDIIIIVGG